MISRASLKEPTPSQSHSIVSLKFGNTSLAYSLSDCKWLFTLGVQIARTKYLTSLNQSSNHLEESPNHVDGFAYLIVHLGELTLR